MTQDEENALQLQAGDALLLVDVQEDFLPGGHLAVPDGGAVVPVLNCYLKAFHQHGLPVFATRDWHPADHCSFREQGGDWPAHCVAETEGARFAAGLDLLPSTHIISKATHSSKDAFSGFQDTDLNDRLQSIGVRRLFVGGLATDYCVLSTVHDALQEGYSVFLLEDAIRAVNRQRQDGQKAKEDMIAQGSRACVLENLGLAGSQASSLFTDLYQLAMLQGYFDQGMEGEAVFEFFVRNLPSQRRFLIAAGLEQVLEYLETLRFTFQELQWLAKREEFKKEFVDFLEGFRFTGDVDAMPEGTVFFPGEPILRIMAKLPQAQFVETRIINLLQYQSLVAGKAARMVLTVPGKILMDFGMRRAHGAEAGLLAARASYLAGFAGTATVSAGALFDIPVFGTLAHSFIQAHEDEAQAFENFARSHPKNVILLIDTYDTLGAAQKVADLAPRLRQEGITLKGVRIDSGDLADNARKVRALLDRAGQQEIRIFASGNLDEHALGKLATAPIDGFGIGSRLAVSADLPYLDCVYKIQEYEGRPRRKRSQGKATFPGRKQVFRCFSADRRMLQDQIVLENETAEGKALLQPMMRGGRRLAPPVSLLQSRQRVAEELAHLPDFLQKLDEGAEEYPVKISPRLKELADRFDHELGD
ncbi:MAG: nicotinate phosphoribosyltransferase [Nitrospinota bacterium]|nr:nicotinate phosphoribosyltransferase [Nitrospinota bacterium]